MSKENLITSWRQRSWRYNLVGYQGNDGRLYIGEPHPHNIEQDTGVTLKTINKNLDSNKELITQISSEVL